MSQSQVKKQVNDIFFRRSVILAKPVQSGSSLPARTLPERREYPAVKNETEFITLQEQEFVVLVVNAGLDMAKEITMQLTLHMPGCSIMYAPSLALAKWILKRRKIHLVVSNAILPDGSVTKLQSSLEQMPSPPDMIVVSQNAAIKPDLLENSGYQLKTQRTLPVAEQKGPDSLNQAVKTLGADLRNDLNNPLQEIVAMVFVAKATGDSSGNTDRALDAIDKAAKNLASVVSKIEDKIMNVVDGG